MKSYTLKDYGKAMGMDKRQVEAYKRQYAWNTMMQKILKPAATKEAPKP
jgi:hypothetical protein